MVADDPVPLLLDTNVIIDLLKLGVLVDVARLPRHSLLVVAEVRGEVLRPGQAEALRDAFGSCLIGEAVLDTIDEEALYATLKEVLGAGEAACLAMAHHRGFAVASDETRPKLMREVKRLIGNERLVRTPELLAEGASSGLLSIDRLQGAVAALAATATSPRERDEVGHLEWVLARVRILARQSDRA